MCDIIEYHRVDHKYKNLRGITKEKNKQINRSQKTENSECNF